MQRTRRYRWRSNQALYPYYIGFWSWIFWACHKGKYLDRFSLFGYFLCFALICWHTSSLILLITQMYPQGRMSHHFREMKVGDYLSVKGPKVIIMFWASDVVSLVFFCGHKKALVSGFFERWGEFKWIFLKLYESPHNFCTMHICLQLGG